MSKSFVSVAAAAFIILAGLIGGCNSEQVSDLKPVTPLAPASTQPSATVAELANMKISRAQLDSLLYESYGLRMMFDLVELNLAKATLAQQGMALLPADVQRERQMIMSKIMQDAPPSDYDGLFEQFLQRERISRAEFEVKVVQTDACLRKIIEPIVVGKLPDDKIHRAFEQLYGAKRRIADITLDNVRNATLARNMCRSEPFAQVANEMSTDRGTAGNGGEWPAFSAQSKEIPDAILQAAFTTDPGQVSDILSTGSTFHIIKVLEAIPPKIVKYDDVKAGVRKQLEDQLVEADIKRLREALIERAQGTQLQIDDPILKGQWDEMVAKSRSRSTDPATVRKQLDAQHLHDAVPPATQPAWK